MPWWCWLLIGIVVVFLVLAFSRMTIHTYYSREKENDRFYIGLSAVFGLVRYRFEVPRMRFEGFMKGIEFDMKQVNLKSSEVLGAGEENLTSERIIRYFRKAKQIVEATLGLKDWILQTAHRTHCSELKWITKFGVGDAAETAILTGVVWGIKSSLLGLVFRQFHVDAKPQVQVLPLYNAKHFETEISCIMKIRVGHAILAGLHLLIRMMKGKGGIRAWQNILSKA